MKEWKELSMAEKMPYLKMGIESGVYNTADVAKIYNTYAKGGYTRWKKKIMELKGIDVDNDPTYDYQNYFYDNQDEAWEIIKGNSHFTDKYKTALHPTFSNESMYSGYKNKYNPTGLVGGNWEGEQYYLSKSQEANNWDTDRTLDYLNEAGDNSVLHASDGSIIMRGIKITPRSTALARSREADSPNTNFMNAQDMNAVRRLRATYLQDLPNSIMRKPHTCINTVTGFYNPESTVSYNKNFTDDPEKYGYTEIPQTEAKEGDIIILSNNKNFPTHAVMFDKIATEDSDYNGYPYSAGDTLVNYSNGGLNPEDYKVQAPLKRFNNPNEAGGDFSGVRRYYKYKGKKK